MYFIKEINRFLIFIILLTALSVLLVRLRLVDKAYLYADSGITQETLEEIDSNKSFWDDYVSLWSRIFTVDGGNTESGESVYSHIGERLVPTLHLAIFAVLFGSILSVVLTMETLHIPWMQNGLDFISKLILSTPVFIFSIILLLFFFYKWELLPPGGYEPGNISYLLLPGISLGIRVYARLQIYLSQESRTELQSPFFLLLKTRGLPYRVLIYKNLLVKLYPTFLVLIVLDLGSLLSGAMVVEEIFFFPGIGRSLYYAIRSMDKELLQSLLVYSGILFYTMNRVALSYQNKILSSEESS